MLLSVLLFFFQVYDKVLTKLKKAYEQIIYRIGDPLEEKTLIGPLHSEKSVSGFKNTIENIKKQGGTIEFGGKVFINQKTTILHCLNLKL